MRHNFKQSLGMRSSEALLYVSVCGVGEGLDGYGAPLSTCPRTRFIEYSVGLHGQKGNSKITYNNE